MTKSRFAVPVLLGLTALCCAGFVVTEWYLQSALPRVPDPATGHVILRNNHGAYVYYSERELLLSKGLFYAGFAFAIAGGLISRREGRDRNP